MDACIHTVPPAFISFFTINCSFLKIRINLNFQLVKGKNAKNVTITNFRRRLIEVEVQW